MTNLRRLSVGIGAAAMLATLSPVAHAAPASARTVTTDTETANVATYQAAAEYFGCRRYPNVLCPGK